MKFRALSARFIRYERDTELLSAIQQGWVSDLTLLERLRRLHFAPTSVTIPRPATSGTPYSFFYP